MQIKDLVINHPNGYLEVKEPIKIKAIGSESIILPGNKINSSFLEVISGTSLEELLRTKITKNPVLEIWEIAL